MSKKIIIFSLMVLLIGVAVSWLFTQPSLSEVDEVFVQVGHVAMVGSVAFSPDGKTALSGSGDNTVKWWDLSTGHVIKTLEGHSDRVNSVAFSPDGKTALLGSSVAFSPDGKTALLGSNDKTVKWWDLSTGNVIKILKEHSDDVESVTFSPDGKIVLSENDDKTVKWLDLSTGRIIKILEGHSDDVESVAFSPDGKTALSGSWDDTLKLWNLATGRVIKTLEGHSSSVFSVAFSPDGKTALSGSFDTTTRLWNLETGEEIIKMVGFDDGEGIAIMSQGYYAASPKGEQYINVRVGNRSYGIDKYKTFYHRPDIIQLALQLGDTRRAIALANQQKRK